MFRLKSIRQRFKVYTNIKLSLRKFDYFLIFVFVLLNSLIIFLSIFYQLYEYIWQFARANLFTLIFIIIAGITLFYFSYRQFVRKKPNFISLLIYFFVLSLFIYCVIGINFLLNNVLEKASFTNGINIFIFTTLFLCVTMLSKYDFPQIFKLVELYKASQNYFYANLGVFLAFALVISVIGYMNVTFVYVIAFFVVLIMLFTAKALLANIRS
ncbi:MAG: hypothetical protein KatS3mg084_0643 [Candidatus Dojkabacteria bacterium]|nr:MAG: hypothetical protein KatS3mg084_0643 [Candidatus Dojkabacteria bacterium]